MLELQKTVENGATFEISAFDKFRKVASPLSRYAPLSSKRNFREAGRCFAAVRTGSNVVPRERCAGTPPRNILCPRSPKLWVKRAGGCSRTGNSRCEISESFRNSKTRLFRPAGNEPLAYSDYSCGTNNRGGGGNIVRSKAKGPPYNYPSVFFILLIFRQGDKF